MSTLAVARRYAGALVELAVEGDVLRAVDHDLARMAATLEASPELTEALQSPTFSVEERRRVLHVVVERLAVHRHTKHFLFLLNDRNRLGAFSAIRTAFEELYDERTGRVRARITSARGLDAASIQTLSAHLLAITHAREVLIEQVVDPTIIGGIVTRVGDLVLDGSVATQLRLLRDQLTSGRAVGDA